MQYPRILWAGGLLAFLGLIPFCWAFAAGENPSFGTEKAAFSEAEGRTVRELRAEFEATRKEGQGRADEPPTHFRVYNKDSQESVTAWCEPNGKPATEVTCKFINVQFHLPKNVTGLLGWWPTSLEELKEMGPKRGPNTYAELMRKDPQKAKEIVNSGREFLDQLKGAICSPESSPLRRSIDADPEKQVFWYIDPESKIRDPATGPKRKRFLEGLIEACSDEDPNVLKRRLNDLERRTCSLYLDYYALKFKKAGEGQWVYTQEKPSLLGNYLKVYEIKAFGLDSHSWTLTETQVPLTQQEGQAAQAEQKRRVWSSDYHHEYEIPAQCDFISHDEVSSPALGFYMWPE